MKTKKAYIKTFGCQMNVHDSEKMTGILEAEGFEITDDRKGADLIIFNTCSIREKAEQKFLSDLGRLKTSKDQKPGLKIAVAGCIAQQMGASLIKRVPYVDYVLGPQNIHSIASMLKDDNFGVVAIDDNPDATLLELPASRKEGRRAWVSIMYGCNNFCTYCIVPYTRGRETSRRSENIINEIKELARRGFLEVTLLGQNVNSYQSDMDFPGLLREINKIDGIKRIRFVTNHPRNLTEEMASVMGDLDKVCESIHLPLQSGSNAVLSAMNRKYTYEQYLEKIDFLRKHVPGIAITTDIIAGFPGETDDDHRRTVNALREIEFDGLFGFMYSHRPGTKASTMDDHIEEDVKRKRLKEILEVQDGITLKINKKLVDSTLDVMLDDKAAAEDGSLSGRTRTNKIVIIPQGSKARGNFVKARITRGNNHSLIAEIA